jgi:hypothetical protein
VPIISIAGATASTAAIASAGETGPESGFFNVLDAHLLGQPTPDCIVEAELRAQDRAGHAHLYPEHPVAAREPEPDLPGLNLVSFCERDLAARRELRDQRRVARRVVDDFGKLVYIDHDENTARTEPTPEIRTS